MKKSLFVLFALLFCLPLTSCSNKLNSEEKIVDFFNQNYDLIVEKADEILNNDSAEGVTMDGITSIYYRSGVTDYIEYYCYTNLSTHTKYWGFYYSSNNQPKQLATAQFTEVENRDEAWESYGYGGNDYYFTSRIRTNWFYYYIDSAYPLSLESAE